MSTLKELNELMDEILPDDFDGASAFSYNTMEDNTFRCEPLMESSDIYEMIDSMYSSQLHKIHQKIILNSGAWAIPSESLNGDLPSKNKDRRRLRLSVCVDIEEKKVMGFIAKFKDSDEPIFREGPAGELATYVIKLVK